MEEQQLAGIEKALKRLTLAVWVLAVALLVMTLPTILMFVAPGMLFNSRVGTEVAFEDIPPGDYGSPSSYSFSDEPGFWEMSIEEKIEKATVIAVTRYEQADDGMMRSTITEILKQEPGISSKYEVGSEFAQGSFYPSEERAYGDGDIIFFTGNPASFQYSTSYEGGRIGGLADIPLKLFRQKCEED